MPALQAFVATMVWLASACLLPEPVTGQTHLPGHMEISGSPCRPITDIAFLLTGNRDHFTRPLPPSTKRPDPDYRKTRHKLTNLEGYAGLDKQLGTAPERDEE